MTTYYFDVDGVLANFHEPYYQLNSREESLTYNFIRNLKPFMNNINLVKALIARGDRVYISTMVANKDTQRARIDWLQEYLPEIPKHRIVTIVGHGNKAEHMKTKCGILIDDKPANCRQWERTGRQAVLVATKGATPNL